ncbi:MAG: hypothetical protein K0S33_2232 [Bacteroidetes bacterium]|jgi:hypothetical protein|nr:hypothetical protein [Bacteroidota bacterium]
MKNIILILSVLTIFTGASCKNKEKAASSNTADPNTASDAKLGATTDKKSRLVVSFKSIGTGIDLDANAKMEKFIKEHPKKPQYDVYAWGREGETDYAFSLKEIKSGDQAKFIQELKAAIGNSDRVSYKENEAPNGKMKKKL